MTCLLWANPWFQRDKREFLRGSNYFKLGPSLECHHTFIMMWQSKGPKCCQCRFLLKGWANDELSDLLYFPRLFMASQPVSSLLLFTTSFNFDFKFLSSQPVKMEDTNLTADWHNEKQPLTSPSHDWQTSTPPGPRSPPTSSAARNTGEYSRLWRSPTFLQSQRTSSETVRVSLEEPPAKYIGVEMNKALHKNRISMSESGDGRPAVRNRKFWSWITNRERTGILSWMPEHLWILASYGCMMGISDSSHF